jgi:hypothetical protein
MRVFSTLMPRLVLVLTAVVYLQYFCHGIIRKVIVLSVQQAAKSSYNVGVR